MLGQDGRPDAGWVAVVSASLGLVLLSGVAVAVLQGSTARADTVLARGAGAVLELPDGTERPAVEGETVPRGTTVRAGVTGARLDTRDREVHLGGATAVTVVDGAAQELRGGFVLVDAVDAPGLELRTGGALVTVEDDALVRVDGGDLARVGVLRGPTAQVRPAGRSAATEVPTYFSVQVPAGGSPSRAVPFALTPGDAYERLLAADLVRADADLTALGSRLDADGSAGRTVLAALARAVPAAPAPVLPVVAPGRPAAPAGERALGFLVATASRADGPLPARYADVRALRGQGGSWGVVAAIVTAPVDRVGSALGDLLDPQAVPVLAGQPLDVGGLLDGLVAPGAPGAVGGPAAPGAGPGPDPVGAPPSPDDPGDPGAGDPGPSLPPVEEPPPAPLPPTPVTPVVEEVVDTVLDLLDPSPQQPAAEPSPPVPVLEPLDPVLGPVLEPLDPVLDPVEEPLAPVLDPVTGLVSPLG